MERMHVALFHLTCLVFSFLASLLGRAIKRHPEKTVRFFSLGTGLETGFSVAFARFVGWFYFVMGIMG
jgi:NO-binding membrane sensor protein with MHYT domain